MPTKSLGKITHAKFGHVGYQECELGISLGFKTTDGSTFTSKAFWDVYLIERNKDSEWTEEDRDKRYAEVMRFISKLLADAKVKDVSQLKDKPVEIIWEGMMMVDWRILTEVL